MASKSTSQEVVHRPHIRLSYVYLHKTEKSESIGIANRYTCIGISPDCLVMCFGFGTSMRLAYEHWQREGQRLHIAFEALKV